MHSFIRSVLLLALSTLSACSSAPGWKAERQLIDGPSSSATPAWVQDSRTRWVGDAGVHRFKSFHSLRGEERISACYTLARLNTQEEISSEILSDFQAALSHSTQGTGESVADIFQHSRNQESRGLVQGLRFVEAFHQRYLAHGVERIDCYVLAELSDTDYRRMRSQLLSPIVQADPALKKVIEARHIDLFRGAAAQREPETKSRRIPASLPQDAAPVRGERP